MPWARKRGTLEEERQGVRIYVSTYTTGTPNNCSPHMAGTHSNRLRSNAMWCDVKMRLVSNQKTGCPPLCLAERLIGTPT